MGNLDMQNGHRESSVQNLTHEKKESKVGWDRQMDVVQKSGGYFELQYMGRKVTTIFPNVLLPGWKYVAMAQDPHGSLGDGSATLPNDGKVSMRVSIGHKNSTLHVKYILSPSIDTEIQSLQICNQFSYSDWRGDVFELGNISGKLDPDHGKDHLGQGDSSTLRLGPSYLMNGLLISISAQGLRFILRDGRSWGGNLDAVLTHPEKDGKTWIWKAGEEVIFDFSVEINREITFLLAAENPTMEEERTGIAEGQSKNPAKNYEKKIPLAEGLLIQRGLIGDVLLKYLTVSYQTMRANHQFTLDDGQVKNALWANYDLITETLLEVMTPKISKILNFGLIPTYSYTRIYLNGSILGRHQDRAACEISVGINIASSGHGDWPLFVEFPSGEIKKVELEPGDAVIFRGISLPHWRDVYKGEWFIQALLHYVTARPENEKLRFDGRPRLGTLPS